MKEAANLVTQATSKYSLVSMDGSRGFHNPELTYSYLSDAYRLADTARATAESARQSALSGSLSLAQSQAGTLQTLAYAGIPLGIIVGVVIGYLVKRKR